MYRSTPDCNVVDVWIKRGRIRLSTTTLYYCKYSISRLITTYIVLILRSSQMAIILSSLLSHCETRTSSFADVVPYAYRDQPMVVRYVSLSCHSYILLILIYIHCSCSNPSSADEYGCNKQPKVCLIPCHYFGPILMLLTQVFTFGSGIQRERAAHSYRLFNW